MICIRRFLGYVDKIGTAYEAPSVASGYGAYIAQVSKASIVNWTLLQAYICQQVKYSATLDGFAKSKHVHKLVCSFTVDISRDSAIPLRKSVEGSDEIIGFIVDFILPLLINVISEVLLDSELDCFNA